MGASNVVASFQYADKVPPTSMVLLVYMAVVSKDDDPWPWFGMGHAALAEHALRRPTPIEESDLRAVRRAVAPLVKVGAITVDRRGAIRSDGANTVRYRLNLNIGDAGRKASGVEPSGDPSHRTKSGSDTGRNVAGHRTKSGRTPDGNRPPKEPRGTKRSDKTEEEESAPRTAVTAARATDRDEDPNLSNGKKCERCRTDHSPLTCEQWRNGDPTPNEETS